MATVFSHAVFGLAISAFAPVAGARTRVALAAALCAVVPDIDVVTFWFGVRWGHMLGHRGITHSLAFAAVLAAVVVLVMFRGGTKGGRLLGLWLVLLAATSSHGVLDAMTDGGIGVAFFAPFDRTRYFLPWRPIPVSPLGITRFFSDRGLAIVQAEVVLVWVPAAILALIAVGLRWRRRRR
jgi:inner membrane protein